eukprot:8389054-Heterocapsa_arctica.AAC.1
MFLSAPASFGASRPVVFSIFLGIVQSTGPVKPSRCLTAFLQTLVVAVAMAICSMSFGDVLL